MEPTCEGCAASLKDLHKYWSLESNVKGRHQWHRAPGPIYCEVCMAMMVYLLQKNRQE